MVLLQLVERSQRLRKGHASASASASASAMVTSQLGLTREVGRGGVVGGGGGRRGRGRSRRRKVRCRVVQEWLLRTATRTAAAIS